MNIRLSLLLSTTSKWSLLVAAITGVYELPGTQRKPFAPYNGKYRKAKS
jgi:hypothetical protein